MVGKTRRTFLSRVQIGILFSVAVCPAFASAEPMSRLEHAKTRMETICSDGETPERTVRCLIAKQKYDIIKDGVSYSGVASFMGQRSREFAEGGTCYRAVRDVKQETAKVKEIIPSAKIIDLDCDQLAEAFASITGEKIDSSRCQEPINFAKSCISAYFDVESRLRAFKAYVKVFRDGDEKLSFPSGNTKGEKRYSEIVEFHTRYLNGDHAKSENRKLEGLVRRTIAKCIESPQLPPHIMNELMSARYDYSDKSWTSAGYFPACLDVVQAFVDLGFAKASDASEITQGPNCAPGRATGKPYKVETDAALLDLTKSVFCSEAAYAFLNNVGRKFSEFNYGENGVCTRIFIGVPIASTRVEDTGLSCENTGSGKSVCKGRATHYCSAADRSRQALDCLTQNFHMSVSMDLSYDAKACRWKGSDISIDKSSIEPFTLR